MRRKARIERFLKNRIYYNLKGVENMKEELHKIVIQGNELYEIDLECLKRKREGKECCKEKDNSHEKKGREGKRK